jgi:hypothetical protein
VNLAGYVPLRRAVFEHTAAGKLSSTECLVFILLVALADRRTGSGTINAPSLRAFLPELSYDAAKRVLCSLESKGYVFRDIVPYSKLVYRFWINKYRPTEGKHKSLQINISKALESRDVNDIEYIDTALEGALEGALETALEGAPNYEKREERSENREQPYIENEVCASASDSMSASVNHSRQRTKRSTEGEACALQGAPHDVQQSAPHCAPQPMQHSMTHTMTHSMHHPMQHSMTHANDTPKPVLPLSQLRTPEELGMFWSEHDGAYREVVSGRLLTRDEFQDRFSKGAAQ